MNKVIAEWAWPGQRCICDACAERGMVWIYGPSGKIGGCHRHWFILLKAEQSLLDESEESDEEIQS